MKRILSVLMIVSVVTIGLFSFPADHAFACSCAMMDPKERLENSAVVFTGKVVDIGGTKRFEHGRLRKYTFEVDTAWKGVSSKKISIYSYDGAEASCGMKFARKQSYLVYAYQGKDVLQTNFCSGNTPVSSAQQDLQQLGAGTVIEGGPDASHKDSTVTWLIWIAAAIGIAFGWILRRRKKRV